MRSRPLIAPLLALAATLAPAQDAPRPISRTVYSTRDVRIIWDADAPPPNINGVLDQLLGEQTVRPVVQRVLGSEPKPGHRYASTAPTLTLSDHSCTLALNVSIDHENNERPAAKELADGLVEHLSSLLQNERAREARAHLEPVVAEVRELEVDLDAIRRRVKEKAAAMMNDATRADLSMTTLEAGVGRLEDERQRLELDLAGMEARLDAVQEQFEKAAVLAAKQADADPVLPELEKAVAAREKLAELTRRLTEAGTADARELPKAEAELIEAKVQLLDRRATAGARGGDALTPLTREMQNLAIDIRDRKARLAHAEKRLRSLRTAAGEFQDLRRMEDEEERLSRSWGEANARLRAARQKVETTPIDRVIVTHSSDTPAAEKAAPAR